MEKFANQSNKHAVDHLGRALPEYSQAPQEKKNKIVGLFYYLWHGYHGTQGPYDITKILQNNPDAMQSCDHPAWPPHENAPMLHWGEPMFGYYLSTDEWVLRRHVQMFIDAGIDVLYFDTTNGFTYKKAYTKLFDILLQLKAQGFQVPKFCFYLAPQTRGCGTGNMMQLWEDLYEPGLYSDLWFYYQGKPLLICHDKRALPDEIRNFFTWRTPIWRNPTAPLQWAWEGNPPALAFDKEGNSEQMAISVCANACDLSIGDPLYGTNMSDAHWGTPVHGRSWHNGAIDTRENATHYGFHIGEQMEFALEKDPPVVFICQWNEWLVPFLTTKSTCVPPYDYHGHDICFRDEFNEEYSRDIEPMKGGYKDAYYLQMASFVRKFKGMPPPAVDKSHFSPQINEDFSAWQSHGISYLEYVGDAQKREHKGYDGVGVYQNETAKNEFKLLKVCSDCENVYFYAECVQPLIFQENGKSLNLYLKIRGANSPAWEGYSFLLASMANSTSQYRLLACKKQNEYDWEQIATIESCAKCNKIHLKIPKALLGIHQANFALEFKWSDNMQENDVMDFYVNGDAAPRGRMNYVYFFESNEK